MAQNAKPKIAKFALFVQLALSLPPYYIMLCYPNPIERNSSYYSSVRNVFYPSKFGAFYVYFQPVSPARTA